MATKRKKRPRDPVALAKVIGDIATGQAEDDLKKPDDPATEFARQGGKKGGKARARALTPERRREIAQRAARARWGK